MDRSHYRSRNTINFDCKGTQKIVDGLRSSNPYALRSLFRQQLQTFAPVNNAGYIPTLPPAA